MTDQSAPILEDLLREHGLGWMLEIYQPADAVLRALEETLGRANAIYQERFPGAATFDPADLKAEAERNPHKVKALLQALGVTNSPEMLVMVWRILQGLRIDEVTMTYKSREVFDLLVRLRQAGTGEGAVEEYRSADINDASLVRHFGIATINGTPLFEGFYPLRLKDDVDRTMAATARG